MKLTVSAVRQDLCFFIQAVADVITKATLSSQFV